MARRPVRPREPTTMRSAPHSSAEVRIDLQIPSTMPFVVSATASSPAAFASWTPWAATSNAVRVQSSKSCGAVPASPHAASPAGELQTLRTTARLPGSNLPACSIGLTRTRRAVVANQDRGDVRRGSEPLHARHPPSPPVESSGGSAPAWRWATEEARRSREARRELDPAARSALGAAHGLLERRSPRSSDPPSAAYRPFHYPAPQFPAPCGADPRPTRTRPHLQPVVSAHGHGRRCLRRRLRTRAR